MVATINQSDSDLAAFVHGLVSNQRIDCVTIVFNEWNRIALTYLIDSVLDHHIHRTKCFVRNKLFRQHCTIRSAPAASLSRTAGMDWSLAQILVQEVRHAYSAYMAQCECDAWWDCAFINQYACMIGLPIPAPLVKALGNIERTLHHRTMCSVQKRPVRKCRFVFRKCRFVLRAEGVEYIVATNLHFIYSLTSSISPKRCTLSNEVGHIYNY